MISTWNALKHGVPQMFNPFNFILKLFLTLLKRNYKERQHYFTFSLFSNIVVFLAGNERIREQWRETFENDLVWETGTEWLADKETKNKRKEESRMSCFKSFPHLSFSPLRSLLSFLPPSLSLFVWSLPLHLLFSLSCLLSPPCLHPLLRPCPQPLVKYLPITAEPGPEGLHMQNAA